MAVVVFDADVLIAYLSRDDAHHTEALQLMRRAVEPGARRLLSAVNYSEVLVGPLEAAGAAGARTVDAMLDHLGIETVQVDMTMARRAATVRAQTRLKLPDAYALATAIDVEQPQGEVRLETFDKRVVNAFASLRRPPGSEAPSELNPA